MNTRYMCLVCFLWLNLTYGHSPSFDMARLKVSKTKEDIVGAVYFMTNNPSGNYIIVNSINSNGQLNFKHAISTEGNGSAGDGNSDALRSQNSLIVGNNNLFSVNAGSNTISMFTINPKHPTNLKLVNQVSSEQDLPVALAFSKKFKMLCAANSGIKYGVQCFSVRPKRLLPLPMTAHSLRIYPTPPGSINRRGNLSDIIFTSDSKQLIVANRANTTTSTGIIASFHVHHNRLDNPIVNENIGIKPYGMVLLPQISTDNRYSVLITDPLFGFTIIMLSPTGKVVDSIKVEIHGQDKTCWVVMSSRTKKVFTVDPDTNIITESTVHNNNINLNIEQIKQYNLSTGYLTDTTIANLEYQEYLYVLTPDEPGVKIMSLNSPGNAKLIQIFQPVIKMDKTVIKLTHAMQGIASYVK